MPAASSSVTAAMAWVWSANRRVMGRVMRFLLYFRLSGGHGALEVDRDVDRLAVLLRLPDPKDVGGLGEAGDVRVAGVFDVTAGLPLGERVGGRRLGRFGGVGVRVDRVVLVRRRRRDGPAWGSRIG